MFVMDDLAGYGSVSNQYCFFGNSNRPGIISEAHTNNYFAIGLVRRPCDHMLSMYELAVMNKETSTLDGRSFSALLSEDLQEFVEQSFNNSKALRDAKNFHDMTAAYNTHL